MIFIIYYSLQVMFALLAFNVTSEIQVTTSLYSGKANGMVSSKP
jgi:hypothetical protein